MRRRVLLLAGSALGLAGGLGFTAYSPVTVLNAFAPGAFTVKRNLAYRPGPRGRMDLYLPRQAQGAPLVVFFYGGSWQEGDKAMYRFVGAALASRGCMVAIPDYRLYPQVRFPEFLEDCASATDFARRLAPSAPLVLMGHSAGAYNAAMLALDGQFLAPHGLDPQRDLAGWLGLAGPYDFLPITDPALQRMFGPRAQWPRTQPINFVTPGVPPAFLAAGLADRTVDPGNSERLAAKLRAHGDAVELALYPGLDHRKLVGALSPYLTFLAPVLRDCIAFINKVAPSAR
ncbi:alpha/beta hydrolase [Acidocella facilis]|uniref:alpha/beta hydrolase n=1 Tax=Acidocella facilis TaxID=525 RepID=UPI001F3701FC|nr:alpha/beta hydrolase [Acidocella facilis]